MLTSKENIKTKRMSLLDKIKTGIAVLAVAGAVGCSSADKKTDYPAWVLPVNVAAGYFGAIATHEAGHALAAKLGGAKKINVDILPSRRDGTNYLGYTEYGGTTLSDSEETWFSVAGPLAGFGAEIASREMLKTGYVPEVAQPTLQWYAVLNKLFGYWEIGNGILREKDADFGKEDIGIALGFLGAKLSYDVYEVLTDKGPFFDVLVGEEFYKRPEKELKLSLESSVDGVGLFFTKRF